MIRLTCLALAAALMLSSCGEEEETGLIRTTDFGDSASESSDVSVGIPGTPPCRSLNEFVSGLNIASSKRFSGKSVDLNGHGQAFAVLFDKDGTPPSAAASLADAKARVNKCVAEVEPGDSRQIEVATDLPGEAVGIHATENGTTTDYAFTVTDSDQFLVVGDQYSSEHGQPLTLSELLSLAIDRAGG